MAYAMTKRGSQDNVITYEFICDTLEDMNAIENKYRTLGTIAIVLGDGLEVYIAGSNKEWNSLSTINSGDASGVGGGLSIYICGQNEVSNGLPDVSDPDETTIYLVSSGNTSGNLYEEYIYVDEAWEKFGAASIDLSNYIQKTDIATQSTAGLVKVLDNGNVTFNENNQLVLTLAGTAVVKTGQSDHPISVTHQHEAAFYGLAKAAGQDMKNSGNTVGTYTTEAASAIRTMIGAGTYSKPTGGIPAADLADTYLTSHQDISGLAPKASPVFTGTIKLGSNTVNGTNSMAIGQYNSASGNNSLAIGEYGASASGNNSVAIGSYSAIASGNNSIAVGSYSVTASGNYSIAVGDSSTIAAGDSSVAFGSLSQANGQQSFAQGYCSIANGRASVAMGKFNVEDSYEAWPLWQANKSYSIGDKVKRIFIENDKEIAKGYICTIANQNANFTEANWTEDEYMNYVEIIGNGTNTSSRSNVRALDWDGNEYLKGDLYVGCNADSTGGSKVATEAFVTARVPTAPVADGNYILKVNVSSGTATYSWVALSDLSGVTF